MTLEKLKALLEAGSITQEEFDELVKTVKDTEGETDPAPETDPTPETDPEPKKGDDVSERLFQSRLDREMAKERRKNAELQKKLERLEKKILSDEEQQQATFEEQQRELEEQRKELMFEKNKMYAVKSMRKAEIGDSEEATLLIEKLVEACADETEIDNMVSLLKAWKDKDVSAEVDKRFKENGYTPKKGESLNGGVNPWKDETFNLTEQIRISNSNPELAAKLKAAAGK